MKLFSLLVLLVNFQNALAEVPLEIQQRCRKENPGEESLWATDFKWGYSPAEMIQKFCEIYQNPGKRLPERAYYDSEKQSLILPQDIYSGGPVRLPWSFVQSIRMHIETAFKNKYIDAVFFPDMGHSHYLVPIKKWDDIYGPMPNEERAKMYEMMFRDPDLKIFYHTAEQLKTLNADKTVIDDPYIKWRHQTRNLAGDNQQKGLIEVLQNPESEANTVGEVPGYYWWGGGFNLSANQNGCFPFKVNGKTKYFDLSLSDLKYKPGTEDGYQ